MHGGSVHKRIQEKPGQENVGITDSKLRCRPSHTGRQTGHRQVTDKRINVSGRSHRRHLVL